MANMRQRWSGVQRRTSEGLEKRTDGGQNQSICHDRWQDLIKDEMENLVDLGLLERKRGEVISFLKGAKTKATMKTQYLTSPLILFLSSPRWLEGRKLGLGFLATAPSVLVPKYHFSIWRKRLLASSLKLSGFSLFIILYKGKRKEEREPDTFSKPTAPFRAAWGGGDCGSWSWYALLLI